MSIGKRALAEAFGTFWLVFGGVGVAVLAAAYPLFGIGYLGVALAFGLTALTMAYAIGHISGGHLNPAVTLGMVIAGRLRVRDLPAYIVAQLIGAILASFVLYLVAIGSPQYSLAAGLGANGFGEHSPGLYSLGSCALVEVVATFLFVMICLGSTDARAPEGFYPIAIGFGLAVANLIAIPVDWASINPARSMGPAVIQGGWALRQIWLFWAAPLVGAAIAGVVYPAMSRARAAGPSQAATRLAA